MNVILPNCRERFTADDIRFICSVLAANPSESTFLTELLASVSERDIVLDNRRLLAAIQDRPDCLRISCNLHFYLVVRHGFQKARLDDPDLADYVAELLSEFADQRKVLPGLPGRFLSSEYLADMMMAMEKLSKREAFALRAHIGDFALFMAGLYPDRIAYREKFRGAPGMDYFEAVGEQSYRAASHLHQADELRIAGLLEKMAGCFHGIRLALNHIREHLLFMRPPSPQLDAQIPLV